MKSCFVIIANITDKQTNWKTQVDDPRATKNNKKSPIDMRYFLLLFLIFILQQQEEKPTAERITVCLAKSSRCRNDRTTNVWSDQVELYFKWYPNSYVGKCKEPEIKDTCSALNVG